MKTIGRYTILGLLGKGGMGKVFKIVYPVTGKIAALKLLDPNPFLLSLMGKSDIEEMFQKEAVTMARIRHPHVVDILDFDTWNGKPFYIMSFYCNNLGLMIGEGYETHRPSRMIPFEKALSYTVDTLKGLACLHDADIIHRDIKPFNLLVTDYDTVKICDFGLSRLRGEVRKDPDGLKVGSPFYTAPEQEDDPDAADRKSDLYSAGVMLYRMLTGTLPLKDVKPPSRFNPDLDTAWDDCFLKAIRKNPDHRYACAESFIAALERVREQWMQKKENICAAPSTLFDETDNEKPASSEFIRCRPMKIGKSAAADQFDLDPLMRPNHYQESCFVRESPSVVRDEATGLLWQVGGSGFPMKWQDAHDYIQRLNQEQFHGRTHWRLPTMEELLTILSPLPQGEAHCLDPVFDRTRKWLWSADRCTYVSAWYLSLDLGFVAANDMSSYYHVKGVCRSDAG